MTDLVEIEPTTVETTFPQIKITPISSDFVFRWDKIKVNTNNLWASTGVRPKDYEDVLNLSHTENWIYRFHEPNTIKILELDSQDLDWMLKAQKIGCMTREFSQLYEDELEETLQKYTNNDFCSDWLKIREGDVPPKGLPQEGWFIRTPAVSLKNGQYGVGPYRSLENIIKSLVSSSPTHKCFKDHDKTLKLYFIPFQSLLDSMKEFRVFVYQGKITGISQQALHDRNSWLTELDKKDELELLIRENILKPYEVEIRPRMEGYLASYTMDLALIGPHLRAYFIEPNTWGGQYAAGSSLFGWEQDHIMLHDPEIVEFRYTKNDGENREETEKLEL